MEIRQLRYFLAVVDHGGVNRAAEALYISQPSVSQSIRVLERDLGVRLFHRASRRMVLTGAGEVFLEHARDVTRSSELARAHAQAAERLEMGKLVIVSAPSQSIDPLTMVVARFVDRYPGLSVDVRAASTIDDVMNAVRFGDAEIGLYGRHSPVSSLRGVVRRWSRSDPFIIMSRSVEGLPLSSRRNMAPGDSLNISDLAGARLIVGQKGTGMRRVADLLIREGDDIRVSVEIEQREALIPLVLAGAGLATVAASWREFAEAAGLIVRTLDVDISMDVEWVYRDTKLSPAATAFLDMTRGGSAVDA